MVGQGTQYKLGYGGMKPDAPTPAANGGCDCSGFICWALGISRKTTHPFYVDFIGGWIATESIFADAQKPVGFFERIDVAKPGALVVYPDKGGHQGHVAIVSEVGPGAGVKGVTKIIHCSKGNGANGDAIQETAATVFHNNPASILCWYAGVTD
jgi:cell wall-associated NlpC family hydrolase